jgi:hypothetical protein
MRIVIKARTAAEILTKAETVARVIVSIIT